MSTLVFGAASAEAAVELLLWALHSDASVRTLCDLEFCLRGISNWSTVNDAVRWITHNVPASVVLFSLWAIMSVV